MLTHLKSLDIRKRHRYGLYRCHCGVEKEIREDHVKSGRIQSCGEHPSAAGKWQIHGLSQTRQYQSCNDAKRRTIDPRRPNYKDYGGRGIDFKFTSVVECAKELGDPPFEDAQINRIDNDGHYEKGNIEWVTRSENNLNRRF